MTAVITADRTSREATRPQRSWGLVRHSLALAGRSLAKTRRNPGLLIDALFMPISRSAPLIGSVLGDAIRYVVAVTTLFGIGFLLGFRVTTNAGSALAAAALAVVFGFSLSWINVLVGVLIKQETVVQSVAFLGIFPLAFGTSMAAPAQTLPGWLQAWVDVNPVNHAVEATRSLLLGGPVAGPVTTTLVWSAIFFAVFAPLAVHAYRRRV